MVAKIKKTISHESLQSFVSKIFVKTGMKQRDSEVTAKSLVFADLRGTHTHGVARVASYIQKIDKRLMKVRPSVKILKDFKGTVLVDGDNGVGQIAAKFAMEATIKHAKENGIAITGVQNGGHIGALAYWSMMALRHEMIGICTSNGTPVMPPWGGTTPKLSNMPISIAAPANKCFPPVVDMALSVAARGNIILAAKNRQKIPRDWAIDRNGSPTDDPEEALKGCLLPVGGVKGSGLAIMLEILTALLMNGKFSKDCGYLAPAELINSGPLGFNNVFLAINVKSFLDPKVFKNRVDELVRYLKTEEGSSTGPEVLMPGEREFKKKEEATKNGIVLSDATLNELKTLGSRFGVTRPFDI
jgi:LDH2 family malate/lactate/ureidoglycolate dehydrogenase